MSGRFQTHTMASEGTEQDDNYQKMVADIEEQTQRSGWLFGRGAFDKADLQYLRDFNNSLRYKEVEIEDKEKALWERERARLDADAAVAAAAAAAQQVAALTRRSSGGSGAHGAVLLRGPAGATSRPAPLVLPVKVKPVGSRTPRQQQQSTSPAGEVPSCKRARTDSAADSAGIDAHVSPLSTAAALRSFKSEPSPASSSLCTTLSAGANGAGAVLRHEAAARQPPPTQQHQNKQDLDHSQHQHQQQVANARTQSAPEIPGSEARSGLAGGSAAGGGGRDGKSAAAPTGLANLLGGYGSEDDDDEEGGEERGDGEDGGRGGGNAALGAGRGRPGDGGAGQGGGSEGGKGGPGGLGPKLPPPVGLLSPEELLADPRVISEGLLATRPQPHNVLGGDAWNSEEPSGSGSGSEA